MSYILEALKKAEAERHTGVPQAAQMVPGFSTLPSAGGASRAAWLWAALPVTAIGLLAAVWLGTRESTPADVATVSVASAPYVPSTSNTQVRPAVAAQKPALAEDAVPKAPSAADVAKRDDDGVDAAKTIEKPTEKPREKPARKPVDKKRAPETVDTRTAKAAATPAEPPIPTLRELPEQVQRDVPPFKLGGYIYSGNRADRSVLVNNRLLREGEEIAPGLLLEQMMPNGMVLSYRGHRFRASY